MESRRRTIELDEDVADALERRAAEGAVSVNDMLAAEYLAPRHVEIPPEEMAELEALWNDWQVNRLGVPAEEVFEWMESWGSEAPLPPPRPRRL